MPILAWGFLGPPSSLHELCNFFKVRLKVKYNFKYPLIKIAVLKNNFLNFVVQEKFLEFLEALFSFEKVRYTSLDDLAADVVIRMEEMRDSVLEKLDQVQMDV